MQFRASDLFSIIMYRRTEVINARICREIDFGQILKSEKEDKMRVRKVQTELLCAEFIDGLQIPRRSVPTTETRS